MTGLSTDYERNYKIDPGSYVETSIDAAVTNDNTERTTSCIAVGPVGNRQSLVKCFDIETGKILHRRTATQLPWPRDNNLIREIWLRNSNLSNLEVVDEQPKLTDPGVMDIPVEDDDEEDLGGVKKNLIMSRGLLQRAGERAFTASRNRVSPKE